MSNPLDDIAPPSELVVINGKEHRVVGVPFRVIVRLAKDSPGLLTMFLGGGVDGEALISKGPEIVACVIAAGFGQPDDNEAMEKAGNLPFDVQLDLLRGVLKATVGGGAGPFVEKLKGMRNLVEIEEKKEEPMAPIKLKVATRSHPSSNISGESADIPNMKSGT